jgi:hypothetical protein
MKSLGLVAIVAIAGSLNLGFAADAYALDSTLLIAQGAPAASSEPSTATAETAAPDSPDRSSAPAATPPPEPSSEKPHLATPGGDPAEEAKFAGFRQALADQLNAHDKAIVDRFLLGVAMVFAVIAAALLFSLPPKPREQKE